MLKVGVTGGIGSGKTMVCKVFSVLGIPVFNADEEAKNIINSDQDVIAILKSLFGSDIYVNHVIDRKKLADIIFNDKNALKKINALIHPKVRGNFNSWSEQYAHLPFVIMEAAILFESGGNKDLDYTIAVNASEEVRIERVMLRDNISEEKVCERMKNQMNNDELIKMADFIINNDNEAMILIQILDIYKKITELKR